MKKLFQAAAFCIILTPIAAGAAWWGDDAPPPSTCGAGVTFETAFSTSDKVAPLVIKAIASAKKSIRISVRSFISKPVSEALVQAGRAGRDVKIIVDRKSNQNGYSNVSFLQIMGYNPHAAKIDESLHAAYIVIDDTDIVLGNIASLQDVDEEKKNPVSVLVIHNAPELAKKYLANWQAMWDVSEEMKKDK